MQSRAAAAFLTVMAVSLAAQAAHSADKTLSGASADGAGARQPAAAGRTARVESASAFSFDRTVVRSDVPVVVEFWAPYCIICRELDEPLSVLAAKFTDRARIVRVNVAWSQKIARRYDVAALPTLLVFKDGAVVSRSTGGASLQDLEDLLGPVLHQPVAVLASK
jgi:thioredoxin 1